MPAPNSIHALVEKFDQHGKDYRLGKYNETQLRRDFLDPFFAALGWDVFNQKNASERYREVFHEVSVEVEGKAKAADYAFRMGDKNIFLVEAKKPSVNIGTNPETAFQLKRYGWSAKLPINILTDFEQLAVYDCRMKPDQADKVALGRVNLYHYSEYIEKWDEISAIFSRQAILQGAFDQFVEGQKGKKGTTEVDDAFLQEIERWRDLLARNIALRNLDLIRNERDLNYAVQMTIDRIIFLRICEDRGIEADEQLHEIASGKNIYAGLLELFKRADTKYNSGLFHLADDRITHDLVIDDKVLKGILHNLYYPESPYQFNYISVEILGQIYEQFLGKVIRLTPGHQAKVEEKPEVRKAGGVYYTPRYIVDYIVKNTLGKLLEGKTPQEAAKLKLVDPACGSGSFLLGAYQYLLDWHLNWYIENEPGKWAKGSHPVVYQAAKSEWKLTTNEKKRILLDYIHGVDIDAQAVEVTKLSLLLKVLEGESGQMSLGLERRLPDLGGNIKCGNSLIGPDYYEARQMTLMGDDEFYRVNAFDWHAQYKEIFANGGFDVVIGNPPYIRIQTLQETSSIDVEFYKKKFKSARKGNYDIYVIFVEKALDILNKNGRMGYILPHKFFNAQYGEGLRELISNGQHLAKVVHFGDQQVFENATTYTCLMFLDKTGHDKFEFEKVVNLKNWQTMRESIVGQIFASNVTPSEWNFQVGQGAELFEKLAQMPTKLGKIADLFVGLQTDADDVYILEQIREENGKILCSSKHTGSQHWFEDNHLKYFLKGSLNIRRYFLSDLTKRLIFPYEMKNSKSILIDSREYQKQFPLTWAYLEECKQRLTARNRGQMGKDWYGYVYKKNHTRFNSKKILVPSIATGSCFSVDIEGKYYFVGSGGGGGGGYAITLFPDVELSYFYLLGILNSNLLSTFIKSISTPFQHGYIALNRQYIEQLPIHLIDFSNSADKAAHDQIVALVEQMLALHNRQANTPQEKEMLSRQIEATDNAIDQLVYKLYGLTEDEVKIVEGKA